MKGTHAGEVHSKIQTMLDLVEQSLDEATVKLLELKQCMQALFITAPVQIPFPLSYSPILNLLWWF